MKRMFAAMLLVFGCGATEAAAPSCWPDVSMPIGLVAAGQTTRPAIGEVIYAASSIGLVWGYTCKAVDGQHYKVIAAGAWSSFPADWLRILDEAMRGTDVDRKALWDKYATSGAWDQRLQSDIDAIWAKLPNAPAVPPPVLWKVVRDPFRTDGKRLIYSVVAGKRGPSLGQYVDAGAPCDPATTITEFGPTYFLSVNGNPNTVARCAK
jgi:hypothetical protein